ncbi:MAG: M48 family metallopeptidase [Phycisphaeraceae bacterium]|nr:M48 family metallopeptidase [Phycisphaeraceae bacterium]
MPSDATPSRPRDFSAYPPETTYLDLIARNRRNSVLLVLALGVLAVTSIVSAAAAVIIYGGGTLDTRAIGLAVAVAAGVFAVTTLWGYYGGSRTLLGISQAQQIDKPRDPELFNVVEELSIAAGLPMPSVHLIDSPALNAFATGRDVEHAAVAVTRGLRERLTREELQAVMAHEMSHVRHLDIRLTMLVATLAGLIVLASDLTWRSLRVMSYRSGGSRRGNRSGSGGGAVVLVVLIAAILLAILAPLMARLIQFAVSRQREYLADAGAVELTRDPQGLINALRKLSADGTPLEQATQATAHLFIVNPHLQARGAAEWNSPFSTHPPVAKRIARLQALIR